MSTLSGGLPSARGRVRPQSKLITRASLDGRTRGAREFDEIAAGITSDLGGSDQVTMIERTLIEGYAGAALQVRNLNARLCLGQDIDPTEHAQAVSSLVRVASRLGLQRRQKPALTLAEYLSENYSNKEEVPHDAATG